MPKEFRAMQSILKPLLLLVLSAILLQLSLADDICPPVQHGSDGSVGTGDELCTTATDCPIPGQLCCSNGYGYVCKKPMMFKDGDCPEDNGKYAKNYPQHCDCDSDCTLYDKCCPAHGGTVCMTPVQYQKKK